MSKERRDGPRGRTRHGTADEHRSVVGRDSYMRDLYPRVIQVSGPGRSWQHGHARRCAHPRRPTAAPRVTCHVYCTRPIRSPHLSSLSIPFRSTDTETIACASSRRHFSFVKPNFLIAERFRLFNCVRTNRSLGKWVAVVVVPFFSK